MAALDMTSTTFPTARTRKNYRSEAEMAKDFLRKALRGKIPSKYVRSEEACPTELLAALQAEFEQSGNAPVGDLVDVSEADIIKPEPQKPVVRRRLEDPRITEAKRLVADVTCRARCTLEETSELVAKSSMSSPSAKVLGQVEDMLMTQAATLEEIRLRCLTLVQGMGCSVHSVFMQLLTQLQDSKTDLDTQLERFRGEYEQRERDAQQRQLEQEETGVVKEVLTVSEEQVGAAAEAVEEADAAFGIVAAAGDMEEMDTMLNSASAKIQEALQKLACSDKLADRLESESVKASANEAIMSQREKLGMARRRLESLQEARDAACEPADYTTEESDRKTCTEVSSPEDARFADCRDQGATTSDEHGDGGSARHRGRNTADRMSGRSADDSEQTATRGIDQSRHRHGQSTKHRTNKKKPVPTQAEEDLLAKLRATGVLDRSESTDIVEKRIIEEMVHLQQLKDQEELDKGHTGTRLICKGHSVSCVIRISLGGKDQGRRFMCCAIPTLQGGCGFQRWFDKPRRRAMNRSPSGDRARSVSRSRTPARVRQGKQFFHR